jgi:hypothetical protein
VCRMQDLGNGWQLDLNVPRECLPCSTGWESCCAWWNLLAVVSWCTLHHTGSWWRLTEYQLQQRCNVVFPPRVQVVEPTPQQSLARGFNPDLRSATAIPRFGRMQSPWGVRWFPAFDKGFVAYVRYSVQGQIEDV